MGAQAFAEVAKGGSADEAFNKARQEALHEHGHGGYTGSIAEKRQFVMIDPVKDGVNTDDWVQIDYEDYAYSLIEEGDPRVDDKWGPAGCIELGGDDWLFFGWASS